MWRQTSPNLVIHAFLNAEYEKAKEQTKVALDTSLAIKNFPKILTEPNFKCPEENAHRHRALMSIRRWMWCEFPAECDWYFVEQFEFNKENKDQIRTPWPALTPNKETIDLNNIILFTHDRTNFTVVEGNHRVTRWKKSGYPLTLANIYVCVSSNLCVWHETDESKRIHVFEAHDDIYDKPPCICTNNNNNNKPSHMLITFVSLLGFLAFWKFGR